ncbi:MAG: LlaJI family restriction endonuclease [Paraclostridium sp.]|uniref:LlaJI family restriction endonuclease n=1 Tax=Paraclostridium sp. TaxID=2023273 RepID=UPI003F34F198
MSKDKIKHIYFKELYRYTKNEIVNLLKIELNETQELIDKLRLKGIVKEYNPKKIDESEYEEDMEYTDSVKYEKKYYFDYVGVIIYNNIVIKCYPKYVKEENKENCLKTILKVIRKYGKNETILESMNGESEDLEFNLLSVILFILYDFTENGVYSNHKDIITMNGDGEIDWDKTINDTYAIMNNGKPLYLDFYTRDSIDDQYNYFRQLHMYVITQCSKIIKEAKLDKLFSLPVFEFEVQEHRFMDDEEVLNNIEKELNIQFITRKQMLLNTIHTFISRRESISIGQGLSFYGTKSFNLVWEQVCKSVLDDKLNEKLKDLDLELNEEFKDKKRKTLLELIEKPLWIPLSDNNKKHKGRGTLRPDIVSIYENDSRKYFIIFDAKYYNITFDIDGISGNPRIDDITKQYLYNLAFKDFIYKHKFDVHRNVFLFPGDIKQIENLGNVKMTMLEELGLNSIMAIKLPAEYLYNMYLNGNKIDIIKKFKIV